MVRIYLIGLGILCIAILANGLAGWLGVKSWYDLLTGIFDEGIGYVKTLSVVDMVWLFLAYPLVLGAGGYWMMQLTSKWL